LIFTGSFLTSEIFGGIAAKEMLVGRTLLGVVFLLFLRHVLDVKFQTKSILVKCFSHFRCISCRPVACATQNIKLLFTHFFGAVAHTAASRSKPVRKIFRRPPPGGHRPAFIDNDRVAMFS
jgi:hypothetical protein